MKKRLLLILFVMVLLFTGCGKKKGQVSETPKESSEESKETLEEQKEETQTEETKEEASVSGPVVELRYSDKGTFEIKYDEENSEKFEYDYQIPMINDGSEVAEKINDEIYTIAKESIDMVNDIKDGKSDIYEPDYITINYDAFENGDIVSIVVRAYAIYSDWRVINTFNYNKATQKACDNSEILSACNISEEDFITQARGTLGCLALQDLDNLLGEESPEYEDPEMNEWKYRMIPEYILDYYSTIEETNVNKDMATYIDGDGDLCVVAFIHVPAGAGQYYTEAKVENKSADSLIEKYKEYAKTYHYDGFEMDCMRLYQEEGFSGQLTHNVASGNEYQEEVYIGFDSENASKFLLQYYGDGYSICYAGDIAWIGVDINGLAFEYNITERDGKPVEGDESYSGKFYLKTYSEWIEELEEVDSGAKYLYIDGDDMLDSLGKEIDLKKTYG